MEKSVSALSKTLQTFFGQKAKEVAKLTKLVQRESGLTGSLFLLIMVVGFVRDPHASYNNLAEAALDLGLQISRQGLEDRCNAQAVEFMREMFSYSLKLLQNKWGLALSLFQPFSGVYLLDSTQVRLPNELAETYPACGGKGKASQAGLKLQNLWELTQGQIIQVEESAARTNDGKYEGYLSKITKGSLLLFDLAYAGLARLSGIAKSGFYYLCRFNPKCLVYDESTGKELALLDHLKQSKVEEIDLTVLVGKAEKLKSRLVGVKLPVEVAQRRRQAALAEAKKKGRKAPGSSLDWLDWNLYLTNVKVEWLAVAQVVLFYRLRWQIELVFKLWKSGAGLERVAGKKKERIWIEIYAKLIGMVILTYLSAPLRWIETAEAEGAEPAIKELSPTKAFQSFKQEVTKLGQGIVEVAPKKIKQVLAGLAKKWECFGMKEQRRDRPTTLQKVSLSAINTNTASRQPVGFAASA
jgi:hypothetical protein